MHINTKGQVTIPLTIRERFNLLPNTEVDFVEHESYVAIVRRDDSSKRGTHIIKSLKNRGDIRMTTDEIMQLTRGS